MNSRSMLQPGQYRSLILGLALLALVVYWFTRQPMPQSPAYHQFADGRSLLGIPNALNVLSNLPIGLVGLLGLATMFRSAGSATLYRDPWERWPYLFLFTGVALTSIGSAYYHLAPDNARLVWDRMPLTFGFMGLLAAIFTERLGVRVGRGLFVPLLLFGVGSVVYWYWSEVQGHGDLRPYFLVQYGSLLVVLLLVVLYRPRYPGTGYLVLALGAYAAAKLFEAADKGIFELGHVVSGHTIKHLVAAGAGACLVAMLRLRVREGGSGVLLPNDHLQPTGAAK